MKYTTFNGLTLWQHYENSVNSFFFLGLSQNKKLLTFSQGLENLTSASAHRRTIVSINLESRVVVDPRTMTPTSAFELNSKWKGGRKERDEEKDE